MEEVTLSREIIVWIAIYDDGNYHRMQTQRCNSVKQAHEIGHAMIKQMERFVKPDVLLVHGIDAAGSTVYFPEKPEAES